MHGKKLLIHAKKSRRVLDLQRNAADYSFACASPRARYPPRATVGWPFPA